jgi:hypothetical protein
MVLANPVHNRISLVLMLVLGNITDCSSVWQFRSTVVNFGVLMIITYRM